MTTLQDRFSRHIVGEEQLNARAVSRMVSGALYLAHQIEGSVPDSREKSIALTKLEEALMWANAGIARHGVAE